MLQQKFPMRLKMPKRLLRSSLLLGYAILNVWLMHQSIPAVPIPPTPPGNRWVFAYVVSPGGGAFTILLQPGGWALANPGHLTESGFRKMVEFIAKDKAFVED